MIIVSDVQQYPQWHVFSSDVGLRDDVPDWGKQVLSAVESRQQDLELCATPNEKMLKSRAILHEDLIPVGWQAKFELHDAMMDGPGFIDARTFGWRPERADLTRLDYSAILLLLEGFDIRGKFASAVQIAYEFGFKSLILGVPVEHQFEGRRFARA